MTEIVLELEGLNCAGCAAKIEKLTNGINGVDNATLDFVSKKFKIKVEDGNKSKDITNEIKNIVMKLEPDVIVVEKDEHSHDHHHEHSHGNINKKDLIKIIFAGLLFIIPWLLKLEGTPRLVVYLTAYLVVGVEIIVRAIKNLFAGQPFDEYFLMTVATLGAFIIGEYPEGVAVMLFYQIGELFQGLAVNHSRKSISSLLDIRSDYANLEKDGQIIVVNPIDVHVGDYIIIKPGEKVPLDGIVVDGKSSVDTSNITGESVPRSINKGEKVLSGFVNNEGLLKVEVEKEFGESTVSKILDLVENASKQEGANRKLYN